MLPRTFPAIYTTLHDLLLQFFLRMSEGAAGSTWAASLLLHVATHVCFVLAVLRRLQSEEEKKQSNFG